MYKLKKSEIEYFRKEFESKQDLFKREPKLYGKFKRKGLLNVIFGEWDTVPRGHWNIKENVAAAAKECRKLGEFWKKYSTACQSAKDNGWFEEVTAHMDKGTPRGHWNIKENVAAAAKECRKLGEFQKKYYGAYRSAKDNGWYEEITAHMETPKNTPTKIRCIETGEVFASQSEATRKMNLDPSKINAVLKGKRKSTGGYSFEYVRENVEKDEETRYPVSMGFILFKNNR